MSVLEPFLRVLSHGGMATLQAEELPVRRFTWRLLHLRPLPRVKHLVYPLCHLLGYYGDGMNDIIVFTSCYLPQNSLENYQYVMDNLFR